MVKWLACIITEFSAKFSINISKIVYLICISSQTFSKLPHHCRRKNYMWPFTVENSSKGKDFRFLSLKHWCRLASKNRFLFQHLWNVVVFIRSGRLPTADTTSHYKLMHLSEKSIDFQRQSTSALTSFSVERWYTSFHCLRSSVNPMLLSYHFVGLLLAVLPMSFQFRIHVTNLHSPIVLGMAETIEINTYPSEILTPFKKRIWTPIPLHLNSVKETKEWHAQ